MNLRKYLGDRRFYRMVLAVAVPIMVQNGITNFVSLLDNIMVGSLGTESMSGVSIVNQFVFVFYLMIFGATSAAGIFTAQYHGLGDRDGVRYTFRFKMYINLAVGAASVLVFGLFGTELIGTFLHDGSTEGDLALTLGKAIHIFFNIMQNVTFHRCFLSFSMVPFCGGKNIYAYYSIASSESQRRQKHFAKHFTKYFLIYFVKCAIFRGKNYSK